MELSLDQPTTLLNAQLSFLDTRLVLIHIPLEAYPWFVNPIVQLLLHNRRRDDNGNTIDPKRAWMFWYPLAHVSVTPMGCDVICPEQEVEQLFLPILEGLIPKLRDSITIHPERFSAILISGEGLDAGQRVLDLTSPLAFAGISIFFITSYYADFILVPFRARPKVISALESRGFAFEAESNGYAAHMTHSGHRSPSSLKSGFEFPNTTDHPATATIIELQEETFALLRTHDVIPTVDEGIDLLTCAGVKDSTASALATNNSKGKLQLGLVKCLTSIPPPKFLAITLTDSESMSLTLERSLTCYFHHEGQDLLLGVDGPEQVAITLNLEKLPVDSTGIVCGVASRLRDHMAGRPGELFTMSYLSTTTAGHVIVYRDELTDALDALQQHVVLTN